LAFLSLLNLDLLILLASMDKNLLSNYLI